MTTRTKFMLGIIVLAVVAGGMAIFVTSHRPSKAPICPEDYTNVEDSTMASTDWMSKDEAIHSDITNANMAIVVEVMDRMDFLIKNHCAQTLKNIEDNGGIEVYTAIMMEKASEANTDATSTLK